MKLAPELLPAFEAIARSLSLSHGFTLMPVQVTGPDLGRALATWLGEHGTATRVVEPLDEPGWRAIVASVLDDGEGDPAGAVMVLGPRRVAPGMAAGLRIANQRRDSIVQGLDRPLLWCGPEEFLSATWERGPDLWSIRGLTHRVTAATQASGETPLWAGVPVADAPERLRGTLERAKEQGDGAMVARVAMQLAEVLLASGEFAEASEVIAQAQADAAPGASSGALALLEARAGLAMNDMPRARAALEDAARRGSTSPASLSVTRGNLALQGDPEAAKRAYEEAAAAARAAGDARNEAVAIANLGVAELALGDAEAALGHLETARAALSEAGDERGEARCVVQLGRTHAALYDAHAAAACFEEALEMARAQADVRGEARVLCHLARAYLETGDAEKAREDATRALGLAKTVGDERLVARATAVIEAAG
jgi:tetratricopeptide (TPR) repeat protein